MFITKNHVYQLIKEDCNLKFDWNEDFHPTNWKKLALKSYFFASAIVNLMVMVMFLGLGQIKAVLMSDLLVAGMHASKPRV